MKFLALAVAALSGGVFAVPINEPARDPTSPVVVPAPSNTLPPGLDISQVYFESVNYGGTGCPQGSVGTSLASDRKTFTLIFDQYIATVGPDVAIAEARKNCQININLHYPGGFQYSLLTADYRGFVDLEANVTGTQKATYYFSGSTLQGSTETNWAGPVSKDYLIHDELPFTSTIWSPCGTIANLNINSQIRLDNTKNKKGYGYLATDSVDGKVTFIMGLAWQACKN